MLSRTSIALAVIFTVASLLACMKAMVLNQPRRNRRSASVRFATMSSVAKITWV